MSLAFKLPKHEMCAGPAWSKTIVGVQAKKAEHTNAILYPDHTFTDWQEADTTSWRREQYMMHRSVLFIHSFFHYTCFLPLGSGMYSPECGSLGVAVLAAGISPVLHCIYSCEPVSSSLDSLTCCMAPKPDQCCTASVHGMNVLLLVCNAPRCKQVIQAWLSGSHKASPNGVHCVCTRLSSQVMVL